VHVQFKRVRIQYTIFRFFPEQPTTLKELMSHKTPPASLFTTHIAAANTQGREHARAGQTSPHDGQPTRSQVASSVCVVDRDGKTLAV
jgi:hypothetical protein